MSVVVEDLRRPVPMSPGMLSVLEEVFKPCVSWYVWSEPWRATRNRRSLLNYRMSIMEWFLKFAFFYPRGGHQPFVDQSFLIC